MVGKALKKMRKDSGLTQSDVADVCGVVAATISRWERGETPIPADKVAPLAKAFHVSEKAIHEIRGEGDDEPSNGLVGSRIEVYRWRNRIAKSTLQIEIRAMLGALPLFLDEVGHSWVAIVTIRQFADRTHLPYEIVESRWGEMLASDFVLRVNEEVDYVLRLKFSEG